MSSYQHFAVAGAGNIGKHIVEALIAKKDAGVISSVTLLSRSSDGYGDLVAKGVKLIIVDYSSPSSIQSALAGVDVVISTLGAAGLGLQEGLASGAKAAGVKLFVPSEFGSPTEGASNGVWAQKDALKKKLKEEIRIPYAVFYTGAFTDLLLKTGFSEMIGLDFVNGKLTIAGSGAAPISWTTQPDIARFVAHVLTSLPKDKIEWRTFRFEGDRLSWNQIAEDWKKHSAKDVSISHRPRSELENALAKNPGDILSFLLLESDNGKSVVGTPEELANNEFPDWKPKKVNDFLQESYGKST